MSNCTTALHLAFTVLNVGSRDEVITVSHSFIATANCIRSCGATPAFVDIDLPLQLISFVQGSTAWGSKVESSYHTVLAERRLVRSLGLQTDLEDTGT